MIMAANHFKLAALSNRHTSSLVLFTATVNLVMIFAADIPDFISIDCGGVGDSDGKGTGLPYRSDANLINSGVVGRISKEFSEEYRLQDRNLRSFPEGVKNCYVLRPESGKNNNYLIRAVFVYGNYDGKNTTPIFQIYLGVSLWSTITIDDLMREAIYMAPTDHIEVCLVNIGKGVPYISALELRRLDNSIYRPDNQHLMVWWNRYDVGGNDTLRYPQDIYDRVWNTYDSDSLKKMETDGIITPSSDDPYKLPESLFKTASATLSSSSPFVYKWKPDEPTYRIYFCFHFAEIEKLLNDSVREMSIVFNDDHTIAESVRLQYLKPQTVCSTSAGLPLNPNEYNYLRISAVNGSNLPPIINGFEVYFLMGLSDSPTFLPDVNAMMDIKERFELLNSDGWQGDPCLPKISVWNGLDCSSHSNPPRIISLNLSRSNLIGEIPFSISNLTELETLDLSYNFLSGSVPEFLAQLPHLKILNLAGNNLGGTVPEALLLKSTDGALDLRVTGNPELCSSPNSCKKKKRSAVPIIVAITVGATIVVLLICLLLLLLHLRNTNKKSWKEKVPLKPKNREYSYSEVVSITDNFREIIGEGGFGKVYKGALKDNTMVAVKLLSSTSNQGDKEFQAEAQLLMIVHHRNLVSLVGYCNEGSAKALIYEYMVNGNLHQQYLSQTSTNVLSWKERVQIAVDAAHGIEYLHNGCKPPIVHRDLKPANILLDEMMQAKIADFGLSRTFPNESQSLITTQLAGTLGYLDPQSQTCGNLNKKSDVYSFGIILFELITGTTAITRSNDGNYSHVLERVTPIISSGNIEDVIDVRLKGRVVNKNSAWKMAEIAICCTYPTGDQRPDIGVVLEDLKDCLEMETRTSSPQIYQFPSLILSDSDVAPCLR